MRLFTLIAAIASGCMGTSNVTRARAHELVSQGAVLVDVRTPKEFAERHAGPAINLPVTDIDARANELDRSKPVIVYCHTGIRAAIAARKLEKAGFTKVYNLGTLQHWDYEPKSSTASFE